MTERLAGQRADIADATDPERLAALEPATRERLVAKYGKALAAIGAAPLT